MQQWKQEMLDAWGLPHAEEFIFNEAWDVYGGKEYTKSEFLWAMAAAAGFDMSPPAPLVSVEDWKTCAAMFEFGNPTYVGLVTPEMAGVYLTHTRELSSLEERMANRQQYLDLFKKYAKFPVLHVFYGLPMPPRELFGDCRDNSVEGRVEFVQNAYLAVGKHIDVIDKFDGAFRMFSNFYKSPVFLVGACYDCVENAFQAAKVCEREERKPFYHAAPGDAKRMGRKVQLRADWEDVKQQVMLCMCAQKFSPGTNAYAMLKAARYNLIIEGNTWHDNYWGDCTCKRCSGKSGRNALGEILMRIANMEQEEHFQLACDKAAGVVSCPRGWSDYVAAYHSNEDIYIQCPGEREVYVISSGEDFDVVALAPIAGAEKRTVSGVLRSYKHPEVYIAHRNA